MNRVSPRACRLYTAQLLALSVSVSAAPQSILEPTAVKAVHVAAPEDDIEDIQEAVGDRDPTYLRTRVVTLYDDRLRAGNVSINRVRAKLLVAFGPRQSFAISIVVPTLHTSTPFDSASGLGDTDIAAAGNLYRHDRFRFGAAFQVTVPTSTSSLLGGANTTIRPAVDATLVFSPHFELTGAFNYKRSVQVTRGAPVKQFEPDITFNTRFLTVTWFEEWDAFWDVMPGKLAQTLKTGASRSLGPRDQWSVSMYYSASLNDYASVTQHRRQTGVDVTWFPFDDR